MMEQLNPKEKAIETISSVFDITQRYLGNKELAILIVEESMKAIPVNIEPLVYMPQIAYLGQVKLEIIKYCDEF